MVLLVQQAPGRSIILPGTVENNAGLATACTIDQTCFNSCAQALASRTDLSVTEACTAECCVGNIAGAAIQEPLSKRRVIKIPR